MLAPRIAEVRVLQVGDFVDLEDSLRRVRLLGDPQALPYSQAEISLERVQPETLLPASYYILEEILDRVERRRNQLLEEGHDLLRLEGRLLVDLGKEEITIAPPIVEEYWEVHPERRRVRVIVDGLHRIWFARAAGLDVTVAVVRDPSEPLVPVPLDWQDVRSEADLKGLKKRVYRYPEMEPFPFERYPAARRLDEKALKYFFFRDLSSLGSEGIRTKSNHE